MGLVLLGATPSDAQPAVRQVLVLQSVNRGNLTIDRFTADFRVELDERTGTPVNFVQIVLGPTGFVGADERASLEYIRATFANRPKPDLIVTVAGPAAVFARKYREQLFPDTPLLLTAVEQRYLGEEPLGDNESAVAAVVDYSGIVDGILRLLPQTRQVFMVMGSGEMGRFWRRELENQFKNYQDRLTFVWFDNLSLQETLRRTANLPPDSAIMYVIFGTDVQGGAYADERVLSELHATANAPLFGALSVFLGQGIVGGAVTSIDDLSRHSADVAVRLLNGAPPATVRVPPQTPGAPVFDWRELQRWGIAESRLPAGSVVRYRVPSLWEEHRLTVLSVLGALIIQALLIAGLLYLHRARRRAEFESRRNLALAADASRRQTMSALTGSIAHELGQPLSSMMHNAQALQMMINADRATPETIGEILSDIQAQGVQAAQIIERHRAMLRSRQLDKQPFDLRTAIKESLALVAHDVHVRQVETTIDLPSSPCIINGDQVLVQQVLVNLFMNAVEAMADTPMDGRHLTIRAEARSTDVEITVRDTGAGLSTQTDGELFEPFVTTKTHGLGIGLTIARSIVDAHGGTIAAHNNPDGGATFAVTLRRAEATELLAGSPSAA